ncbi:MAG: hypothetical protein OXC39_04950 [Candidatus Dadabacteria bacterium]|nr:hypothetical protein [Candidatus Dadabacteria bacterium]
MISSARRFLLVLVAFFGARQAFSLTRARFSLLSALALLLVALGLFAAAPAEAQDPIIPTKPRNVQVTAGNAKLTLNWQAPSSWGTGVMPRGYEIDWFAGASAPETDSNEWVAIMPNLAASATSHTLTGTYALRNSGSHTVANGAKYWFRIRAFTTYPNNPSDIVPGNYVEVSGTPQAPPTVSFELATLMVYESDTAPEDIKVQLSAARTQSVTVGIGVKAGATASAADYTLSATSVTFAAGETEKTITVIAAADMTTEGNEQATLTLTGVPSGIEPGTNDEITLTFVDDSLTPPTVSLSASPNPVPEGSSVTVTATLSAALSSSVSIPVTLTDNTAESGDHGSLTSITIAANQTSGTGTITTAQDPDKDHETFTVSLGSSLPSGVLAGSSSSVTITILDDDKPYVLSVNVTPSCGSRVTDLSVEPLIRLSLEPPPASMARSVEYAVAVIDAETLILRDWMNTGRFDEKGKKFFNTNSIAALRIPYPGFTGFAFRLADDHSVEERCLWTFAGRTPTDTGGTPPGGPPGPPAGSGGPNTGGTSTGGGGGSGGGGGGGLPPSGSGDEPPPEDEEPSDPDQPDACGENDRELERFYEALEGDDWDKNENWNSDEAPQEWFGVETDEDGNVVSLRLSHNALSGDMPARELRCLSELKELALWGNDDLLGDVPEEFVLAVERAVLRDIAEMLNINPEWFENYEDPYDFEDWHRGVTTDDDGRVTELDFTGEEIEGEIPESVFELRRLGMIETGCGITMEVEVPKRVSVTMPDGCAEETADSGSGGCALGSGDSSVFGLFLVTLLAFAVLGRTRARG